MQTHPRQARERAQVLALLYLSGATLVLVAMAFPFFLDANRVALLGIVGVAYVVGAWLFLDPRAAQLPDGFFATAVALGSTLVAAGCYFAGPEGSAVIGIFYIYASTYAFYYFARRLAIAETVYAGLTYAAALWLLEIDHAVAQWIIVLGASAFAGALIGGLGSRAVRQYETQRRLAAQLREVDDMKTSFLRAVGHELRTPMATARGYAQILASDPGARTGESGTEMFGRLDASLAKMSSLLEDLLRLDRLRSGRVEPDLEETDLADLVAEVVADTELPPERLRLEFEPTPAAVDAPRMRRAVSNLLTNAAKYSPPDTVVRVVVRGTDGWATIVVEDEGAGVPDEMKRTVFEPFVRGIDAGVPGSGVGLSLVRQFAYLHGGDAWVEDRPGGGARFVIRLPAAL